MSVLSFRLQHFSQRFQHKYYKHVLKVCDSAHHVSQKQNAKMLYIER
jgi:hypothetical protein